MAISKSVLYYITEVYTLLIILKFTRFCCSLNKVLEYADDIVIDVPKLWDYLAEFLSPIVYQCTLPLSFLSSVPSSLVCING